MVAARSASTFTTVGRRLASVRAVLLIFAVLLVVYAVVIHPWLVNWGASEAEQQAALPGDELNPNAQWQTTRAVTIHASADDVWAWLIQHGQDRAGFYSYTWLENIVGADIRNVDELRPEWQQRTVGDAIPMARRDLLGGRAADMSFVRVLRVEPGQALVVGDASGSTGVTNGTGAYIVQPVDANATRLIVRERNGSTSAGRLPRLTGSAIRWLIWDPMHFVMQRRMMLGIKDRAEGHPQPPAVIYMAARIGWSAAAVAVLALYFSRRRFRTWLLLPAVATLPALLTTGDVDAALAAFLAVGITTLGMLAFGQRWWPALALIGAGGLLVLVLAPDAYIAFGMIFAVVIAGAAGLLAYRNSRAGTSPMRLFRRGAPAG